MIKYFCECETPEIWTVKDHPNLQKGQSFQECLKCMCIIEKSISQELYDQEYDNEHYEGE